MVFIILFQQSLQQCCDKYYQLQDCNVYQVALLLLLMISVGVIYFVVVAVTVVSVVIIYFNSLNSFYYQLSYILQMRDSLCEKIDLLPSFINLYGRYNTCIVGCSVLLIKLSLPTSPCSCCRRHSHCHSSTLFYRVYFEFDKREMYFVRRNIYGMNTTGRLSQDTYQSHTYLCVIASVG